ncbi:DNA (cytosine-5)-methyltransferase 1 [Catenuloplanes nepalensis]|uniref:DNA (cytosine-5-)-methyltransferase n=1 Tax=Catenuloplanes nepalensis TaxID=587533 RepID=A0ABT9N199_9ACTN|nr:DNA cytosine methyltransferase [Catenuloplanes nepalensis]MDP9797449.1 DNA (cytosine-5)-methyltransferase 1 [Catenuloplanes nepalensis]
MLTVADYFCGAGGSSTGMHQVPGVRVVMASNHWQLAVDTHNANFPDADHDREDITRIDPRRHPRTDIGWFSPECTNWSVAKGKKVDYDGKPVQPSLFDDGDDEPEPDEAALRSRMLMQDVPRFAEVHRYRAVIVENVTDVLKWEHLGIWLARMVNLGYAYRIVVLNSAFAAAYGPGAPQLRDRVYFCFWRRQYRQPDFAKWTRPRAWCPSCGTDVAGVYVDKQPGTPRTMRYGQQYFYRCPRTGCRGTAVHPYALPAVAAIDLDTPGGRIGDRTEPLKPKTRARIEAGLRRYARPDGARSASAAQTAGCPPLLVPSGGGWNDTAQPVDAPMRARTTRETEAVCVPPMLVPVEGRDGKQARHVGEPMRAQTARAENALVIPLRNNGVAKPAAISPLLAFAAAGTHQGLLMRHNTVRGDSGYLSTPVGEPMRALTTAGHQSLIGLGHAVYGYDTGTLRPVAVPLPAQTTIAGDALLGAAPDVDDCTFRMLTVDEIRAGMAFTPGYVLLGTSKRDKVRMLGNAVTPPAARDLVAALAEAITGDVYDLAA